MKPALVLLYSSRCVTHLYTTTLCNRYTALPHSNKETVIKNAALVKRSVMVIITTAPVNFVILLQCFVGKGFALLPKKGKQQVLNQL
jgi:hypothetical protein